jgi:hypothetical protein
MKFSRGEETEARLWKTKQQLCVKEPNIMGSDNFSVKCFWINSEVRNIWEEIGAKREFFKHGKYRAVLLNMWFRDLYWFHKLNQMQINNVNRQNAWLSWHCFLTVRFFQWRMQHWFIVWKSPLITPWISMLCTTNIEWVYTLKKMRCQSRKDDRDVKEKCQRWWEGIIQISSWKQDTEAGAQLPM